MVHVDVVLYCVCMHASIAASERGVLDLVYRSFRIPGSSVHTVYTCTSSEDRRHILDSLFSNTNRAKPGITGLNNATQLSKKVFGDFLKLNRTDRLKDLVKIFLISIDAPRGIMLQTKACKRR